MSSELSELYQEIILDLGKRPRNHREIEGAEHTAEGFNPLCGDRVNIYVSVEDHVIRDISFEGSGCAISTAAASIMTEAVVGKTFEEAMAMFERFHDLVTHEDHDEEASLGKLEAFAGVSKYPARVKCATLAWHTLKAALDDAGKAVTTE